MRLPDYDLTSWYLNLRRVAELVGTNVLVLPPSINAVDRVDNHMHKVALLAQAKDALVAYLRAAKIPTLGQLILTNKLKPGQLFTHYGAYYCKGVTNTKNKNAELHTRLIPILPAARLRIPFAKEHLTAQSAYTVLSGRQQLFVFGVIQNCSGNEILAYPYVVASLVVSFLEKASHIGHRWSSQLEVHVDSIDSFARVRNLPRPKMSELKYMKDIPEKDVKNAFAEIIGEPWIPKDWGGERSDLVTSRLALDGDRINTAFAFKGPAKFKPLVPADLGKQGDQIVRLFQEPVELCVLQHCHEIKPTVRATMRAFATRIDQPRLFCLIDGYDTLRLFKAYKKCGLKK